MPFSWGALRDARPHGASTARDERRGATQDRLTVADRATALATRDRRRCWGGPAASATWRRGLPPEARPPRVAHVARPQRPRRVPQHELELRRRRRGQELVPSNGASPRKAAVRRAIMSKRVAGNRSASSGNNVSSRRRRAPVMPAIAGARPTPPAVRATRSCREVRPLALRAVAAPSFEWPAATAGAAAPRAARLESGRRRRSSRIGKHAAAAAHVDARF